MPTGKLHDVLTIRTKFLAAANAFVDAVFITDPLSVTRTAEDIHAILTATQKKMAKGFNKAYVEKARLSIPSAIDQVESKYLNRLYGRLLNCAAKTGEKAPAKRQYLNIPVAVQDKVLLTKLQTIEKKLTTLSYNKIIDMVRSVVIHGDLTGLTDTEILVIRTIHADCLEKYRKPVFGSDPRYICQINLDYRVIRSKVNPVPVIHKNAKLLARLLVDTKNHQYHHFLEISSSTPRGESIKIPIAISSRTLKRFDELSSVSSLSVIIEPDAVIVRTIINKPDHEPPLDNKIMHLIGRDFGMTNTASLSVVKLDDPIDPEELKRISKFTKDEALKYLTSFSHPNDNIVEWVRFSGKKFLDRIDAYCSQIDYLKSQIDTGYNNLDKLKSIIIGYLGLKQDTEVSLIDNRLFDDKYIRKIHSKFFRLLNNIKNMKKRRLAIYKKIADSKKHWFGFVSNQEALLAKKYHAAVVRENLTILATEKKSTTYKGRTFNKTINNGSKGQYMRRASDKLRWDGIPELIVPSFYTSTACTIHSLVDADMRRGETFAVRNATSKNTPTIMPRIRSLITFCCVPIFTCSK